MKGYRLGVASAAMGAAVMGLAGAVRAQAATIEVDSVSPEVGQVIVEPDLESYEIGTLVTFTAIAEDGYQFDKWSGDFVSYESAITVEVNGDMQVTASFVPIPNYALTLIADPSGAGTILLDPAADEYEPGTEVTLTALASPGYAFKNWDGDVVENVGSNGVVITVNDDMDIVAVFSAAAVIADLVPGSPRRSGGLCGSMGVACLGLTLTGLVAWRRLR